MNPSYRGGVRRDSLFRSISRQLFLRQRPCHRRLAKRNTTIVGRYERMRENLESGCTHTRQDARREQLILKAATGQTNGVQMRGVTDSARNIDCPSGNGIVERSGDL
jgi:hypothetical protein